MGVGSTVPGNDTSHFAQHPHNVGDVRTMAVCPQSAGAGSSGGVKGSTW
jgi:hypothetical protein